VFRQESQEGNRGHSSEALSEALGSGAAVKGEHFPLAGGERTAFTSRPIAALERAKAAMGSAIRALKKFDGNHGDRTRSSASAWSRVDGGDDGNLQRLRFTDANYHYRSCGAQWTGCNRHKALCCRWQHHADEEGLTSTGNDKSIEPALAHLARALLYGILY